jgi:hypothetical protein
MHAMEAGFLTHGSFYWPTPSQRLARQWLILLAFVPVHSGASVRELHPLPASFTSIARTAIVSMIYHLAPQMSSTFLSDRHDGRAMDASVREPAGDAY